MSTFRIDNIELTNPLDIIYGGTKQSFYTTGDMLYASSSNTISKLKIGTEKEVLTSNGNFTGWNRSLRKKFILWSFSC